MAHFKKIVKKKHEGKVVYGDKIVNGIVYLALAEIPYVELYSSSNHTKTKKNSINVYLDKDGVHIEVFVKIHFSQCVSDMAFKIQEAIRHNVETMIEYHVASVNVVVKGVLFDEIRPEKPPVGFDDKLAEKQEPVLDGTVETSEETVALETVAPENK